MIPLRELSIVVRDLRANTLNPLTRLSVFFRLALEMDHTLAGAEAVPPISCLEDLTVQALPASDGHGPPTGCGAA